MEAPPEKAICNHYEAERLLCITGGWNWQFKGDDLALIFGRRGKPSQRQAAA